jgi:hypothetical protein
VWPTQDDEKIVYAHLVQTWVRKLGPCQVLIVKLNPDDPPDAWRYWATSRLEDNLTQVVGHVAQRWTIEVLFADFKELMGSDHYQIRSAQGIVRFWAVGLCLYQFLDEVRAAHQRLWGEHLSLGKPVSKYATRIKKRYWIGCLNRCRLELPATKSVWPCGQLCNCKSCKTTVPCKPTRNSAKLCHPEQSEGSQRQLNEILRFAQPWTAVQGMTAACLE